MLVNWSQEQISLFSATAHYVHICEKTYQHYILCSDDLDYDKDSIYYR